MKHDIGVVASGYIVRSIPMDLGNGEDAYNLVGAFSDSLLRSFRVHFTLDQYPLAKGEGLILAKLVDKFNMSNTALTNEELKKFSGLGCDCCSAVQE